MLFLLSIMLLSPFRLCEGSPTYQEEYRGSYVPKVIKTEFGPQVVAPDTPYVAAAGPDKLHFIDTRFHTETAKRIKEHIEKATVPKPDEYIAIDEILTRAEVKNHVTGETTFVFDPGEITKLIKSCRDGSQVLVDFGLMLGDYRILSIAYIIDENENVDRKGSVYQIKAICR